VPFALGATPARAESGPCGGAVSAPAPHPPGGQPEPYIGGNVTVMAGGSATAVAGATLRLHRCDGEIDTTVATQSSNGSGAFTFTGLSGPSWYYVVADLTGPLSGLTPTAAPMLIGVGAGTNALALWYQ
jgi:hypothetical protein